MNFILKILSFAVLSAGAAYGETLRVLSYNVQDCFSLGRKGGQRVAATAEAVRKAAPDVAGIQELDRKTTRSGGRDIAAELAEGAGMFLSYGPAIDFQGGKYGIGILSKKQQVRSYTVPLPGKEERRALEVAEFPGYVFFCTHFSLTEESQRASVPIVNAECAKFTKPVILVGDFNTEPTSDVIKEFEKSWRRVSADAPTFPADNPKIRIDHIFVHSSVPVRADAAAVLDEPSVSDHRPTFVTLTF